MRLDKTRRYVFMLHGPSGEEWIGVREWNGRAWKTWKTPARGMAGRGEWEVILSTSPLWRNGPRMVLEVPA